MEVYKNNPIVNKYLDNIITTGKYSHAYLFSGINEKEIEYYVRLFVKSIFCLNNNEKKLWSCNKCKICNQIENNNYIDFYIVNIDGEKIKKEEILKLKDELSVRATYNKKIYWIKNIDELTRSAANSILKVLEEPEDNIMAILSTSRENQVLDTILSRCQLLKINCNEVEVEKDEKYCSIENIIYTFINDFQRNNNLAVLNLLESIKDKDSIITFFETFKDIVLGKQNSNNYLEYTSYLLENILISLNKINYHVSSNLVLENFLFNLILNKIDITFLKK